MNRSKSSRSGVFSLRTDKKPKIGVTGKDCYYTVLNFFAWHVQIINDNDPEPVTLKCAIKDHALGMLDEYNSNLYKNPKDRDTDASWLGITSENGKGIDIPVAKTLNERLYYETSSVLSMDFFATEHFPICIDTIHNRSTRIVLYYHRESDPKHVEQVAYSREFFMSELSFVNSSDGDGTLEFSVRENEIAIVLKVDTNDNEVYRVVSAHVAATPSDLMRAAKFVRV